MAGSIYLLNETQFNTDKRTEQITTILFNYLSKDKSDAIFCHQEAAWVPDIFWNFNSVKNHKSVNNSTTTEAREKMKIDFESTEF